MKILTAYTDKFRNILKITLPRLHKYCTKHDFRYVCTKFGEVKDRPHSWYKIQMFIDEVDDFLLWIDADAIILNTEFNPYSLVEEGFDFYVSKDFNGINFGVVMVRCNDYVKTILEEVWNRTEFLTHPHWEQAAFIQLVSENFLNINSKIKYIPQKIFNAYEYSHYGVSNPEGQVCDETFIFHTPSLALELREQLIRYYHDKNA
jgi:hypothetical protein